MLHILHDLQKIYLDIFILHALVISEHINLLLLQLGIAQRFWQCKENCPGIAETRGGNTGEGFIWE